VLNVTVVSVECGHGLSHTALTYKMIWKTTI